VRGRRRTLAVYPIRHCWGKDVIHMSEEELATRRALQESLDLRDQGHTDA